MQSPIDRPKTPLSFSATYPPPLLDAHAADILAGEAPERLHAPTDSAQVTRAMHLTQNSQRRHIQQENLSVGQVGTGCAT